MGQGHNPLLVYQGRSCHAPRVEMKGKEPMLKHVFDATEDGDLDQLRMFPIRCLSLYITVPCKAAIVVVLIVSIDPPRMLLSR